MTELVSIILTTYNRAYILPRTLDNLMEQTYSNIEIIIIEDCSDDKTSEVVKSYITSGKKKFPLKYYRNSKNLGLPGARNIGIRHAKGKYITFMDDDDLILPQKTELQVRKLQATNTKVCYCGMLWVDSGKVVKKGITMNPKVAMENGNAVTALYHKTVFDEIGGFDEKFRYSFEDGEFLVRLNKEFESCFVKDDLYIHHYYENQMTSGTNASIKGLSAIIEKHKSILTRTELSAMYLKLAVYRLINKENARSDIKKSISNKPTIRNIGFGLISLFPMKQARFFMNKILDKMGYPKSYGSRYR